MFACTYIQTVWLLFCNPYCCHSVRPHAHPPTRSCYVFCYAQKTHVTPTSFLRLLAFKMENQKKGLVCFGVLQWLFKGTAALGGCGILLRCKNEQICKRPDAGWLHRRGRKREGGITWKAGNGSGGKFALEEQGRHGRRQEAPWLVCLVN